MGSPVSKQYLTIGERPLLAHTLGLFDGHPLVSSICLITPSDEIGYCRREIVAPFAFKRVCRIVPGGAERQDSVRNGLMECDAGEGDVVLVHDGARPFFSPDLIEPLVRRAADVGACIVGVPVKDTVKDVRDGLVFGTPDRNRLWQIQTPQAFRFELLREAHERALLDGFYGTDDASLVERLGRPVAVLKGDYRNIKVTTPEDLVIARAFFEDSRKMSS